MEPSTKREVKRRIRPGGLFGAALADLVKNKSIPSLEITRGYPQNSQDAKKPLSNDTQSKAKSHSERCSENSKIHNDKSYKWSEKHNSNFKSFSNTHVNGKYSSSKQKYQNNGKQNYSDQNNTHRELETTTCIQEEEYEDCIEFSEPKHQRVIADSGKGFTISFKNDFHDNSVSSPHTTSLLSTPSISSLSSVPTDSSLLPASAFQTMTSVSISNLSSAPSNSSLTVSHVEFNSSVSSSHVMPSAPLYSLCPNVLSTSQPNVLSLEKNSNLTDSQNEHILFSTGEDCFIPPPSAADGFDSDSKSLKRNGKDLICNDLESTIKEPPSPEDEVCPLVTDPEHLEAITSFIEKTVNERTVSSSPALIVVRDLNRLFKDHFKGNVIDIYGSYHSNLAITTSDINLVVVADVSVRKSFLFEIYKVLNGELERYHVHPFEEQTTAHKTKINFSHPDTGINCELVYLGKKKENIFQMGKFLKGMSILDDRVRTLIIATKIWAEYLTINDVEDGKLHPIGYALLVIHFLQSCENPILPVHPGYCDKNNSSSVGELWIAFLRYYSVTFNWKQDVVTVNSKEIVSKKSKSWENYWIAIEDPFTGKNVAETVVNCDVADYIKGCFKSSYEYFCNPSETGSVSPSSSSNGDCQNNGNSSNNKYEFSFQECVIGRSNAYCEKCDEIDDVCDDCKKKLYVQPMASVPKMTDGFLDIIKTALMTIYDKYMLSEDEINERKDFVKKLQKDIGRVYPDAQLKLFGSSTNGFGFKHSDLDICVTFKTEKINSEGVLKDICRILRKDRSCFDNVIPIFNATIPIIKFHTHKGWRGDISLDNSLAVHNSELLYTYSLIDERCKILGCALKLLAKKALVAEVTEKALSSYSYLNMVIHFLQQVEPPVLPVLQDNKFRVNGFSLDDIVENCNVWFCKDLNYIETVFKKENTTSVEQLWLNLLDYYCSFSSEQFITIRQKETQYVNTKRSSRLFNIQDPFIETKNLGCVVSSKKAEETKNVLNRARQLFRTPVKEFPSGIKDIEDYFFSTMSLTGRIHKEAHCNLCGKFGHEQKECKQSCFPLRRPNFRQFGQFRKCNAYKNGTTYRNPTNRPPYRKQQYSS